MKSISPAIVVFLAIIAGTLCGCTQGEVSGQQNTGVESSVSGVYFRDVFGVDRSELQNIKEYAAPERFQEGSEHGHTRFETAKDVKPRDFEKFKLLQFGEADLYDKKMIVKDFVGYFPEDKTILDSEALRVYSYKSESGTRREFVVEPTSKTYFYQWKIAEYQSPGERSK